MRSSAQSSFAALLLSIFLISFILASCTPYSPESLDNPTDLLTSVVTNTSSNDKYEDFAASTHPSATQLPTTNTIENPIIAEVIRLALKDRVGTTGFGGEAFCSYSLLMPIQETNEGETIVYLWTLCNEFFVIDGELRQGSSISIPVALMLDERNDGWNVEIRKPEAGNWSLSIQEIFPPEIWNVLFVSDPDEIEYRNALLAPLHNSNIQQAVEIFGLPFEPTPTGRAQLTSTPRPTSFIHLIPLTPTATLDLSTFKEVSDVAFYWTNNDLHVMVQMGNDYNNGVQLTSFQKGLLSKGWRVQIHQFQENGVYSEKKSLVLENTKDPQGVDSRYTFFVETTLEELQTRFIDRRDLVCQVVNQNGNVVWQSNLYLSNNFSWLPEDEYREGVINGDGVVVGYPNLLSQDRMLFLHEEKFITVKEPPGGFYNLLYIFNLARVEKPMSVYDLEEFAKKVAIRVFPYQGNGSYSVDESYTLTGEVSASSGIFSVDFPFAWLNKSFNDKKDYYLRIEDVDGNIIKEEFFHFIPNFP